MACLRKSLPPFISVSVWMSICAAHLRMMQIREDVPAGGSLMWTHSVLRCCGAHQVGLSSSRGELSRSPPEPPPGAPRRSRATEPGERKTRAAGAPHRRQSERDAGARELRPAGGSAAVKEDARPTLTTGLFEAQAQSGGLPLPQESCPIRMILSRESKPKIPRS